MADAHLELYGETTIILPISQILVLFFLGRICNRTPAGTLAPGAAQLDYLLTLPTDSFGLEPVVQALRALTSVSVAAALDPMGSGALEILAVLDVTETEPANSLQTER